MKTHNAQRWPESSTTATTAATVTMANALSSKLLPETAAGAERHAAKVISDYVNEHAERLSPWIQWRP